jgi:hypothetical protein
MNGKLVAGVQNMDDLVHVAQVGNNFGNFLKGLVVRLCHIQCLKRAFLWCFHNVPTQMKAMQAVRDLTDLHGCLVNGAFFYSVYQASDDYSTEENRTPIISRPAYGSRGECTDGSRPVHVERCHIAMECSISRLSCEQLLTWPIGFCVRSLFIFLSSFGHRTIAITSPVTLWS